MFHWLKRLSPQLLSLMRIAVGLTFIEHGTQKLLSFPVPKPGLALPLLLRLPPLRFLPSTSMCLRSM